MHHTCAQLHAWIYNTRDQRSLASIVSQGPSSLQDPRTETAHSVLNQNIAYQDQQLKSDLRANCLGQQFCPGSTRFVAVKEWPSKWLKILTQRCLLSVKFVRRCMGSPCLRRLGLLVAYDFTCIQTAHVQVRSAKKWSGFGPTACYHAEWECMYMQQTQSCNSVTSRLPG